ncbi:MAG: YdcF family protein [Gammaproteobacteria bacterium]|nr:YdcF family protein [Gammaproteobacteria bacterium]
MDSLFFWISKLAWLFVAPDNVLLLMLTLGVILLWFGKLKWSKIVLSVVLLLMLFIALFPVGEWLLYPLESKYSRPELPKRIDGIIVLSGAENTKLSRSWGTIELNSAAERDISFIALSRRYPQAKLVFTGGSGSMIDQSTKGADIAKMLFLQQGLNIDQIIFERDSRNSYENVIFSHKLVQPHPDEKWLLITTAWHMPRSRGIFCKSHWDVIPYPVDYRTQRDNLFRVELDFSENLKLLVTGVKEWLGIVAYSLSGKMDNCS